MNFDPNNKIVQLCVQGMNAEFEGDMAKAQTFFQEAWDSSSNDFERFTSAHYLARNQQSPFENLKWNLIALEHAGAIKDNDAKTHYPSLLLNVARSYEILENNEKALEYFQMAAGSADSLPVSPYGETIRSGINAGLKRLGQKTNVSDTITNLIHGWCENKDLKSLALVLPAYVGYLGTREDINKLLSAFSFLFATKGLKAEEQSKVEQIIDELNRLLASP
jgi:tetratricopeptide (TPR) repeat protein